MQEFIATEQLLCSQNNPLNPLEQLQMYEPASDRHVPLFSQGFTSHSMYTINYTQELINSWVSWLTW